MPKIIHYRNKCIGCNSCVEDAPNFWKISKADGKSCLIGSKKNEKNENIFIRIISEIEVEENKQAEKDCPVGIIKVVD